MYFQPHIAHLLQGDQHYEPIQDALLTTPLYEEVLPPSSSLQVQENLNMMSGHTSVTNENYSSASVRLTMSVPLLNREIVTSQNEAYGCAIGTSGQGCTIRSGEHLICVPKYMEEQAFPLLERDVNKPQADPYYHSCETSGQTGINENCSSSLSSYEEVTPPTTPQRREDIETLENEAYNCVDTDIVGKFNTTQAICAHDQESTNT